MVGQTANIITMLAALLTGGFLMVFIENQQIAGIIAERFDQRMRPFFNSFTNYVKFIASVRTCYSWNPKKGCSGNMIKLKRNIEEISRYGGKAIASGQSFSPYAFNSQQLEDICNQINDIWYCIDKDHTDFKKNVEFDENIAKNFSDHTLEYLRQISPKYSQKTISRDVIYQVSGEFFVDFYQPIQDVLPEYELWKKKEKIFRCLSMCTIVSTICSMLLIMVLPINISHRLFVLFQDNFPIVVSRFWIEYLPYILCLLCSALLIYELYKLVELEKIANRLMR